MAKSRERSRKVEGWVVLAFWGVTCVLSYLGLCLELAEDHGSAFEAFSDARDYFERIGLQTVVHDCEAGLARCSLANEHFKEALQTVDRLWDYLHKNGGTGLEFPIKAYLTCGTVYKALDENEKSKMLNDKLTALCRLTSDL